MDGIGWPELLIIAVVVLVLFGSTKLPGAARSLGRSLRIFKAETKGLRDDDAPAIEPGRSDAAATNATQPVTGQAVSEQPVAGPPASTDAR
ncbi:MAG: Sec-independent protein translocase subunit TatA [Actinomycetes bacterium]